MVIAIITEIAVYAVIAAAAFVAGALFGRRNKRKVEAAVDKAEQTYRDVRSRLDR